jgi:hypothetical protein
LTTPSFHHDHLKAQSSNSFTNNERDLVALTGYSSNTTPVFINTDDIFACTPTEYATPTFCNFLSTFDKPINDLITITAVKTHFHCIQKAISLPPCLAHHITAPNTWNNSWELLHLIIKDIVGNAKWWVPVTVGKLNDKTDEAKQAEEDKAAMFASWDYSLLLLPILISL